MGMCVHSLLCPLVWLQSPLLRWLWPKHRVEILTKSDILEVSQQPRFQPRTKALFAQLPVAPQNLALIEGVFNYIWKRYTKDSHSISGFHSLSLTKSEKRKYWNSAMRVQGLKWDKMELHIHVWYANELLTHYRDGRMKRIIYSVRVTLSWYQIQDICNFDSILASRLKVRFPIYALPWFTLLLICDQWEPFGSLGQPRKGLMCYAPLCWRSIRGFRYRRWNKSNNFTIRCCATIEKCNQYSSIFWWFKRLPIFCLALLSISD